MHNFTSWQAIDGVLSTRLPVEGRRCFFCNREFLYPSKLERHMRTHTGERPFPCLYCNYSAKHRADLNRHMYSHHSKETCSNISLIQHH